MPVRLSSLTALRRPLTLAFVTLAASALLAGPAQARPGSYWLDVCHDTGLDVVYQDATGGDIMCSGDAWVQGYGGNGERGWAYVELSVYNSSGQEIVHIRDGLRPTSIFLYEVSECTVYGELDGSEYYFSAGPLLPVC